MPLGNFINLLFQNISVYIIIFIYVFVIYFCLFRKYIFSLYDPAFFLCFVSSAFATSTVIFLYYFKQIDYIYFFNYCATLITFYLAFFIFAKKVPTRNLIAKHKISKNNQFSTQINETYFTIFFIFTLFHILHQLYIYLTAGIPLFMESRLTITLSEGIVTAFFSRIIGLFTIPAGLMCYYVIFFGKKWKKIYAFFYLFLLLFFSFLSGSKGAILNLFFTFSVFIFFTQNYNRTGIKILKSKIIFVLLLFIILLALLTISIQINQNLFGAINHLILRFSAYGDGYVYAYPNDNILKVEKLSLVDFIFGDFLHTFRLSSSKRPQGYGFNLMDLAHCVENSISGPNPRFNLVGYSYFGFLGSLILSFIAGGIFAFSRNLLLSSVDKTALIQIRNYYIYQLLCSVESDIPAVIINITTNLFLQVIILLFFILILYGAKKKKNSYVLN